MGLAFYFISSPPLLLCSHVKVWGIPFKFWFPYRPFFPLLLNLKAIYVRYVCFHCQTGQCFGSLNVLKTDSEKRIQCKWVRIEASLLLFLEKRLFSFLWVSFINDKNSNPMDQKILLLKPMSDLITSNSSKYSKPQTQISISSNIPKPLVQQDTQSYLSNSFASKRCYKWYLYGYIQEIFVLSKVKPMFTKPENTTVSSSWVFWGPVGPSMTTRHMQ